MYDDADADADIDHEYFNSLQSSSVQHSSHNGPAGFHNGSFAYDNESQFIHRPNFGQHGCRDQPIELDDFEDDLDDSPEITDDLSGLGSHQPVRVYSNVDTTRRGAVSETSNVGISAPSTSGPSFQQSLQHDGASRGTMYPQQVQFNAATRRSDAELAKHNADKKQNKAQEISFKIQGQWWHRLSVRVAAGIDPIFSDRERKTNNAQSQLSSILRLPTSYAPLPIAGALIVSLHCQTYDPGISTKYNQNMHQKKE